MIAKPTEPIVKIIPNSYLERAITMPIMMTKLNQAGSISIKVESIDNSDCILLKIK